MTGVCTVLLRPIYRWTCPACGAVNLAEIVPIPESACPEVAARVRARWRIPADEPVPPDKLFSWPKDVACAECDLQYFSEIGELSRLKPAGD
jgi:hypothetical protein